VKQRLPNSQDSFRTPKDFLGAKNWEKQENRYVVLHFQNLYRLSTTYSSNVCNLAVWWAMWLLEHDDCVDGCAAYCSPACGEPTSTILQTGTWLLGAAEGWGSGFKTTVYVKHISNAVKKLAKLWKETYCIHY